MFRSDGSIKSVNTPINDNRYRERDFGLYKGVIRDIVYTDDENNDSSKNGSEVLYNIQIIGTERDGQIFPNVRMMKGFGGGGFANFEEITLKETGGISNLDPTDPLALADPSINHLPTFNGDVVYIQFVGGNPLLPIIVGMGYHQSQGKEATEDVGPRFLRKYNGIGTKISRDGEFTWAKDNGEFVPFLPNPANPKQPFVNQFAPFPGQAPAVVFTLGNEYDFLFKYRTGLEVSIDGVADEFKLTTAAGASVTLNGEEDSFALGTTVGTAFKVDGTSDSLDLTTAAGAAVKIDGINDTIKLSTAFGDSLAISAADGVQVSTPTGATLSMKNGEVTLTSGGQATLDLGAGGFIKLGNASGDVLKILQTLIQTLSTETAAGFGAPLTNVAQYVQLLTQIQLITGG